MAWLESLDAEAKREVLEEAKVLLERQAGAKKKLMTFREIISQALWNKGWFNMGVGGARETSVTSEIQRSLGLDDLKSVDLWSDESSLPDVQKGIDATIADLA